jgi:hypothetical protein
MSLSSGLLFIPPKCISYRLLCNNFTSIMAQNNIHLSYHMVFMGLGSHKTSIKMLLSGVPQGLRERLQQGKHLCSHIYPPYLYRVGLERSASPIVKRGRSHRSVNTRGWGLWELPWETVCHTETILCHISLPLLLEGGKTL